MINKSIGPLFFILLFFEHCLSQVDTITYKIYLKEYSILRGQIISQDADSIVVFTTLGKNINLSRSDIKKIENGNYGSAIDTKKELLNIGYTVDNAHLVNKGKFIFTSNLLIFSKFHYGLSDKITVQGGFFLMPTYFSGLLQTPGVKGFYHKSVNEKLAVAGSIGVFITWEENTLLNNLGGIVTYGGKEKNISIGVHKLFNPSGSLIRDLPLYDITTKYTCRPYKKIAISLEAYYSKYENQYTAFLTPAIDLYFKSAVMSFTLNARRNKNNSFIFPFVGFKVPINLRQ